MYTNADILTNKVNELKTIVKESRPDIIAITESKPKNLTYDINKVEFEIEGYTLYTNSLVKDNTRGCILYVRNRITANEIEFQNKFDDSIWVEIKLKNNDKLAIGCIYRSPNSDQTNNQKMLTRNVNVKNITENIINNTNSLNVNIIPSSECIGTVHYVAPEIENYYHHDYSSDIYSLGVILYVLITDFENSTKKFILTIMITVFELYIQR